MKATSKSTKTRTPKRSLEQGEADPSRDDASDVKDVLTKITAQIIPNETGTPLSEVTQPMLGKVSRAFQKAGEEASKAEQLKFAEALLTAGVPILSRSSGRISRAIRGEINIEDLKVSRRATT
jgi:hypothetical protein